MGGSRGLTSLTVLLILMATCVTLASAGKIKDAFGHSIYFNPETEDIVVHVLNGLNVKLSVTAESDGELRVYTVTDRRGNEVILTLKVQRGSDWIKAKVVNITFNGDQVKLDENLFEVKWLKGSGLRELAQKIIVENQLEAEAEYNAERGTTVIEMNSKRAERKGLWLLKLEIKIRGDKAIFDVDAKSAQALLR